MAIEHSQLEQAYQQLSAPLQDHEVEWRLDQFKKNDGRARLVPYMKHDVVVSRLNEALGFGNWSLEIHRGDPVALQTTIYEGPHKIDRNRTVQADITEVLYETVTTARLIIHTTERDIVFEDVANDTAHNGAKGSVTRALPRVARLLNMGIELYYVGQVWVSARSYYDFDDPPPLEFILKRNGYGDKAQSTVITEAAKPPAPDEPDNEPTPPPVQEEEDPARKDKGIRAAKEKAKQLWGDDAADKLPDYLTANHLPPLKDQTVEQLIETWKVLHALVKEQANTPSPQMTIFSSEDDGTPIDAQLRDRLFGTGSEWAEVVRGLDKSEWEQQRKVLVGELIEREIKSFNDLTQREAQTAIDIMQDQTIEALCDIAGIDKQDAIQEVVGDKPMFYGDGKEIINNLHQQITQQAS